MSGTATYRLLRGRKRINDVWYEAGDLVDLTEAQALNLRLSIEPVGSRPAEFKTTLAAAAAKLAAAAAVVADTSVAEDTSLQSEDAEDEDDFDSDWLDDFDDFDEDETD